MPSTQDHPAHGGRKPPRPAIKSLPNKIKAAHDAACVKLANIRPPRITASPAPGDFGDIADYLKAVLGVVDELFHATASEAQSCSNELHADFFRGFLTEQVEDHDLLGDFTTADEALREQRTEAVSYPHAAE